MKKAELDLTKQLIITGKNDAVERFIKENNLKVAYLPTLTTHYSEFPEIAKDAKGHIHTQSIEFLLDLVEAKKDLPAQVVTCFIVEGDRLVTRVIDIEDARYVYDELGLELR